MGILSGRVHATSKSGARPPALRPAPRGQRADAHVAALSAQQHRGDVRGGLVDRRIDLASANSASPARPTS
jgi:hypothetical protein